MACSLLETIDEVQLSPTEHSRCMQILRDAIDTAADAETSERLFGLLKGFE